jgi:hypothetical protein
MVITVESIEVRNGNIDIQQFAVIAKLLKLRN